MKITYISHASLRSCLNLSLSVAAEDLDPKWTSIEMGTLYAVGSSDPEQPRPMGKQVMCTCGESGPIVENE